MLAGQRLLRDTYSLSPENEATLPNGLYNMLDPIPPSSAACSPTQNENILYNEIGEDDSIYAKGPRARASSYRR
jgi:hypothetical protein